MQRLPTTRRQFLFVSVATAGALTLAVPAYMLHRRRGAPIAPPMGLDAWVRIDADGTVTARSNVPEMGQGSASALLQALADELDVDWQQIRIEPAPVTDSFAGPEGHYAGGSNSIRSQLTKYRELGAGARVMLIAAAAKRWDVPAGSCITAAGQVQHPASGRALSYGELATDAAAMRVPKKVSLKPAGSWRYLGQPVNRLNTSAKVTGTARYGIDVDLPGLKVATILHCPVWGGRLRSVESAPAMQVAGVEQIIKLDDSVAVIANGYWQALQGLRALQPEWEIPDELRLSNKDLSHRVDEFLEQARKSDATGSNASPVAATQSPPATALNISYSAQFLAQCPMEPMNATARQNGDRMEVWAPSQAPSQGRELIAEALGIDISLVEVFPIPMGGAFGRRLHNDYAIEAAQIAQRSGLPVKVIWSREEDFARTTLRTMARARFEATLDSAGLPRSLTVDCAALDSMRRTPGLDDTPYRIPDLKVNYAGAKTVARVGYWRSVAYSQNTFFFESFIDECAAAGNQDPFAYRLRLLEDDARNVTVLRDLQKLCDYDTSSERARHIGIAFSQAFGSRTAVAVELRADASEHPAIARLYCVLDCGFAANPDAVKAQVEGGLLFGLSAALQEEITLAEGQIQQRNFDSYQLLRMPQVPEIIVKLISDAAREPGGVGETAVPPVAPAVANALARLTGQRRRTLPLGRA
jgi:isoquinoline 1-oxidoreductase beta subunit